MDKKSELKIKQQPKNTVDIRSFFNLAPTTNITSSNSPLASNKLNNKSGNKQALSSSGGESPIKKSNSKPSTQLKEAVKMPKRKKAYAIESDSDDEIIIVNKKAKKEPKPSKATNDKKENKKRKIDPDESEEDYQPDFDSADEKPAKKATTIKKSTKAKSAKAKATPKSKAIPKDKLVRPPDESEDENALKCKIVKTKNKELVKTGFEFNAATNSTKTGGDKKNLGVMWVDKYKPTKISEVIGQHTPKCSANKLKDWLNKWYENKDVKVHFGAKNETGIGLRACLVSGPPGIGKTTTAQLTAKECNFEFVEYNASDTRNKKTLDGQIYTLLTNKTLDGYVHDRTNKKEMTGRNLLIMDEVDGMSGNADRGGIAELIQFIKKTDIPIICICNDRNSPKIRNLANYCFDLRFQRPKVPLIKGMINKICQKESVKISDDLLNEVIEMSNHDIRQVIHYFSVFATKNKTLSNVKGNKLIKNVTLSPFDAVKKMFTEGEEYDNMSFREKSDLFFNDYQLLPLMAYENYIHCKPKKSETGAQMLSLAAKSIDAICIGDMMETQIKSAQMWNLLPYQAVFSCLAPGYYMNGHFSEQIQFASFFGKLSTTNKKFRLLNELKQHMNLKITGNKDCLNLDYLLPLRDRIIKPLLKTKENGIESAIDTLTHYSLPKEDLDSIIELTLWNKEKSPYAAVETKIKTALTKNYNKRINPFPFTLKDQIKKVGANKSKKLKLNSDEDDEKEEEEVIDKDETLIPEF